jgi:hypothetical protein
MAQQNSPQRIPRDTATRETEVRTPRQWLPPSLLPEPAPEPGYVLHWKRLSVHGEPDVTHFNKILREGWEPCKLSDHPELRMNVNPRADGQFADMIEMGGLILCRMPKELRDQRNAYYSNLANAQQQRVTTDYLSKSDPRMPMLDPTVTSKVEFGRDRASGDSDES